MAPRTAGQHAREKAESLRRLGLLSLGLAAVTGLAGAVLLGFTSNGFLLLLAGVIVALLLMNPMLVSPFERWDRGAKGEEDVGAILDALRDDGWHAIHDVSLGRGNIDHVLVGPAGLLTVETKSHRGRRDVRRLDERWLRQAYAEAKGLSEFVGRDVAPLLVFSRAYLHPWAVSQQRGVMVLPARMLAAHLARRPVVLTRDEVTDLHARLLAGLERAAA